MTRLTDPLAMPRLSWRPHYESAPYVQHPSRREHVYGPIHAMTCGCKKCRVTL